MSERHNEKASSRLMPIEHKNGATDRQFADRTKCVKRLIGSFESRHSHCYKRRDRVITATWPSELPCYKHYPSFFSGLLLPCISSFSVSSFLRNPLYPSPLLSLGPIDSIVSCPTSLRSSGVPREVRKWLFPDTFLLSFCVIWE